MAKGKFGINFAFGIPGSAKKLSRNYEVQSLVILDKTTAGALRTSPEFTT